MQTPFGVEILSQPAYTYGDYILLPVPGQNVAPGSVDTSTCLGGNLRLNIPIVGANMGHLGGRMAEKIAQLGGIGILSQDFRLQETLKRIRRVKEANPYFHMPIVLTPEDHTADALAFMTKRHFDCVIVVDGAGSPLGLITRKDLSKIPRWEQLKNAMKRALAIVDESISMERASDIMIERQIHHLPVVNRERKLVGCLTPLDIALRMHNYRPALDQKGRLLVGVAMGMKPKESLPPLDLARMYLAAEVDVLVLDVANGYLRNFVEFVAKIRREIGNLPIIAGNVADYEGAMRLLDAGCDTVKVGIGPGGACTTRRETGVGVPQKTALEDALRACRRIESTAGTRYILADGGIRGYYDLSISMLLGSAAVMIGSLFAGTYESAFETDIVEGEMWKRWRGNASSSAATYRRKEIYGEKYITEDLEHSEGADGLIRVTGSVTHEIFRLVEGLKRCMAHGNSTDLASFQSKREKILRLKNSVVTPCSHISQLTLENLYIKPQPSDVLSRKQVDLATALTPSLPLNIPFAALPADFVQKKICTTLAQLGGIGFLSRKKENEPIERMVDRVHKVKDSHPLYFLPSVQGRNEEIGKTIDFLNENAFSCAIVVKDFQKDWTPVGIATQGDLLDRPRTDSLYEVVKPNIYTVPEGIDLHHASGIMLEKGIHHLPVVDAGGKLVGCITPRDIALRVFYRLTPNIDASGRLRVGASLVAGREDKVVEEAMALEGAGVDILLFDTDNGYSSHYLESLRTLRQKVNCPVIAAGVSTYEGAVAAFLAGADVVKVGVPGLNIPYLEAIRECSEAAMKHGKAIVNDDCGNIKDPRDAYFTLLMGASAAGLRNILAPTFENSIQSALSPSVSKSLVPKLVKKRIAEVEYIMEDMEATALLKNSAVKIEGSVINVIVRFVNGLRSSCTYSNASNLGEYQHRAIIGMQSFSGYYEGSPHAFADPKTRVHNCHADPASLRIVSGDDGKENYENL